MSFQISLKGAASIELKNWLQRKYISSRSLLSCLVREAGENVSALGGCVLLIRLRV